MSDRRYRAGDSIEDICRACKLDRMHAVVVVDEAGRPLRVACGYCGSEHNYRGGSVHTSDPIAAGAAARPSRAAPPAVRQPFELVTERERTMPPMSGQRMGDDVESLLRRIIREESGLTPVPPADKWRDGLLVLRPGTAALQEKSWPIETFFHKIVMLRNRLRTLEQQINALEIPEDAKLRMQSYITGCYGSLTSFNVLFADEADQFRGSGGE